MSTSYSVTVFLDGRLHMRGTAVVHPVLYVEPEGQHRSACITFQIDSKLSVAEQARVAERFAAGVTAWCEELSARAEQERTAETELAEARAEIARLKAEAGEGS